MGARMTSDLGAHSTSGTRPTPMLGGLAWVRGLRTVLWLLVVTGPALAFWAVVELSNLADRVDLVDGASAVEPPADTGPVEGFAELYVTSYLTSDMGSAEGVADVEGRRVLRTVSLGAERIADGYYAVTVAAELEGDQSDRAPGEATSSSASVVVYRVGVVETDAGWTVVGPPAVVSPPATGPSPDLLVGRLDGLDGVPGLDDTVVRFLSAYLIGDGELTRYAAPGSQLAPVLPPPFASVELLEAGTATTGDGAREVVVVVGVVDETGRGQVLQFGLLVGQRDGRWEVAELLSAPSLAEGSD